VIPQAVSPLRFEIKPTDLAIHEKALFVIEQLEGSHVNVPDLVTCQARTVASRRESPMGRFGQILLRGGGEQA
jgi:hypothetical protein